MAGGSRSGSAAGGIEAEHTAYGVPFPPLGERFDRLEEQLEILTGLWSHPVGERYSFKGAHYAVADSPALPKPVQRPYPPVIVGGLGARRTPALAARFANEFNVPFAPVELTRQRFGAVRAACEAAGRDPRRARLLARVTICCADDQAELERRAMRIGRDLDDLRQNSAAGSPQEVVTRLLEYRDAGASRSYLQVIDLDDLDHVALIAAEVMPHLSR